MNSRICIAALCLVAIAVFVSGDAPVVDKKLCRETFSVQNRKQLSWINTCVKQLGYKTGREKTQKSTCVWKCVLENFDMLNDSGFVNIAQYDKHLEEQWPANMIERANYTFQPCLKFGGTTNPGDEFCKGYDPLIKCLNRNFANLCKGL